MAHRRFSALRSIKVLRPICKDNPETGFEGCQDRHDKGVPWHKDCLKRGHDPYYGLTQHKEKRPVLVRVCAVCEKVEEDHETPAPPAREGFDSDEAFEAATVAWSESYHDFKPGKMRQEGTQDFVWYTPRPNLKQVTVTPRAGGGNRYNLDPLTFGKINGYIFPHEHEKWREENPGAIGYCQYHNCWTILTEKNVVRSQFGDFCDEDAARAITNDMLEVTIDARGDSKRERLIKAGASL